MEKQFLNLQRYDHDGLKLAFVSVHNETAHGIGVIHTYRKFLWSYDNVSRNDNALHNYESSFFGALLTTKIEHWTDEVTGPYDFEEAYAIRKEILAKCKEEGFVTVGGKYKKGERRALVERKGWSIWLPQFSQKICNKTMAQFFKICDDFMVAFPIDEETKSELKRQAYFATYSLKSKSDINNKGDLFDWLLEQSGVEIQQRN